MESFKTKGNYDFEDLVSIIRLLRSEDGCPWDREQTHESIKKNLIEETYEVIEAINKKDDDLLLEELGDLMMQVVFHSEMAAEKGKFDIHDVSDAVCKKLVLRHPHVFGDVEVNDVEDVLSNWDSIKRKTKGHKTTVSAMDSVPRELPALMRSTKIQKKAKEAGFDWQDITGVLEKLDEETAELKAAISSEDYTSIGEELGDLLFTLTNLSRFTGHDAEEALTESTDKFVKRYAVVEELALKEGINLKKADLSQLNRLWDIAKRQQG
ncbi:MAG: nucleoside triphosphate pyrophosphohydrolase [Acutalibacteraceae bacterium]